ncbi:hypothetical protein B0H21DRAFT_706505 [Amylocystis lapponica]|nr:hypothetical protein B0H21DRAFT_706505 [Amylocystis lapponica]
MSCTTSILDLPNELLLLAWLGLIKDEQEDTVSWTDIALDCIARDGFCTHPQCGGGLLEWNVSKVPFFGMEDGFLRPDSKDVTLAMVPSLLLRNHPIASRSLATFPAMETMVISTIAGHAIPDVVRPSGVTVWDVQANIQSVLDIQLHVSDLNTYLLPMVEDFNPLDWDIQTVLKTMETLRSAFEMIRWSGLEWDRGPYGVDSFFVVFLEAEDRDFSRWKRFM